MDLKLQDKLALVSGSSKGICFAIAGEMTVDDLPVNARCTSIAPDLTLARSVSGPAARSPVLISRR